MKNITTKKISLGQGGPNPLRSILAYLTHIPGNCREGPFGIGSKRMLGFLNLRPHRSQKTLGTTKLIP